MAHNHGTRLSSAKMRCGAQEGLSVLGENHEKVRYIFTDGLIGCAQIILGNERAGFTCHLMNTGEIGQIEYWAGWAIKEYLREYGQPKVVMIAYSNADHAYSEVLRALNKSRLRERPQTRKVRENGGAALDILNGRVFEVPNGDKEWAINSQSVVGYITQRRMIDMHFTGRKTLGETAIGDYFESCGDCNNFMNQGKFNGRRPQDMEDYSVD